jgi:RHS repeat-associated protein
VVSGGIGLGAIVQSRAAASASTALAARAASGALATFQTTSAGTTFWQAAYAPYGAIYALATPDAHQPLRRPGQEAEEFITGNPNGFTARYYNGFRWYRSALGRYTQADPVGYSSGAFSLYAYAGSDPLNETDPYGLGGGFADVGGVGGVEIGTTIGFAIGGPGGAVVGGVIGGISGAIGGNALEDLNVALTDQGVTTKLTPVKHNMRITRRNIRDTFNE